MNPDKPRRYKIPSKAQRQTDAVAESKKPTRGAHKKRERDSEPEAKSQSEAKPQSKTVCGHEPGCVPMPFMGYITWTDPRRKPDVFALRICCTPDGEFANICMKIPTRDIASIELRPARRPMHDHAGHVADGIRLAGGDTTL